MIRFENLISTLREAEDVAVIKFHRDDIVQLMPGVEIMFDFDQQHRAHQYDLWLHSCHTVVGLPRNMTDDMLYLAGLLHDIGKPYSKCKTTRGVSYVGHPEKSVEIVRDNILPVICSGGVDLSDEDMRRLLFYIEYHDCIDLRSLSSRASVGELRNLVLLQIADAGAHIQLPAVERRILVCKEFLGILEDIKGYVVHDDH